MLEVMYHYVQNRPYQHARRTWSACPVDFSFSMGVANAPEPLTDSHQLAEFDCGNGTLDDWLKKHALKNQDSGASRTFVIYEGKRVVGFYALASGSVERISAPASITRNMLEAVPVMVLGRLADEHAMQGQGLDAALLKDALLRTLAVA